jgi:sec-independent protein translocase protein TatA
LTAFAFLSIGIPEMMVIGLVALLIFGGRLPEVMGNLGRAYARFRRGLDEVARPIREEMRRLDREADPYSPPARPATDASTPAATPFEPPGGPGFAPGGGAPPSPRPREGGAADEPPPV